MNKKDWSIIIGTLSYGFLFYHQNVGLNFLLFSIILICLLIWLKPELIKSKNWLLVASLTLLAGTFVLLYGSSLAIFSNCICFLILPALSTNNLSSIIVNLCSGIWSVGAAIALVVAKIKNELNQNADSQIKNTSLKFLTFLIPAFLILIFFFLYKNANPLFENYTNFISGEWILFNLGGLYLIYGFIHQQRIKQFDEWENQQSVNLDSKTFKENKLNEKKSFTFLFVVLNAMLIFINILDINYLYLGAGMPEGITHKEFVHKGVNTLIFSILLGISLVLYSFRGALNFSSHNKMLKMFVYLWLIQNLFMVFSTVIRNYMYIDNALLTYKRIGVYYWLFFAALGLITTGIKVWKVKRAWYLIRSNSFIGFIILVISAGVDWDTFITNYNLRHSKLMASLDKRYLLSLSETNVVQLYAERNSPGFNIDSVYHYGYYYRSTYSSANQSLVDCKLYDFMNNADDGDWRSFNYRKQKVKEEIKKLNNNGQITSLDLLENYVSTLKPIFSFSKLKIIKIKIWDSTILSELIHFKNLEELTLYYLKESEIQYLKKLKNLKLIRVLNEKKEIIVKLQNEMPNTKIVVLNLNGSDT
jgi:hypothetical protein